MGNGEHASIIIQSHADMWYRQHVMRLDKTEKTVAAIARMVRSMMWQNSALTHVGFINFKLVQSEIVTVYSCTTAPFIWVR